MTETHAPNGQNTVAEQDVIAFLQRNRDFFKKHPALLEKMTLPPQEHGTGVVDFRTALVERLKADNQTNRETQKELIETFRANMHNQSRIYTAVLVMLEAESFEEFAAALVQDLPVLLDVDTVNVVIESAGKEIPFVQQTGLRFARTGFVNTWLGDGDALLQNDIQGAEELFGSGAGLVRSHALLRLEISPATPAGILAFGSRDPDAFHDGQSIDQIGFLAQVIERCFRIWLDATV